ncbi:thiol reductant ABC exporter subunit CydD [Vreelandella boliviensis]|uniref:ATP-binding/permease protein CydD n=1 Tax=Vreelandella boliviensis LC1 TaxID=1072583 RepID=A0A265E0C3_9GAMM|nr:thiol reductant ABC exporter subunit CydD [Halomonas boliviensis]EHJ93003.1 ATP-binding/permease protein CydD [Halomonas boliviensis LC1]OZT75044.1 thiol reductant ABC exporter subunit CydD [Halomonas boliviensis LC1]
MSGATDAIDPGQRLNRCLAPQRWWLRGATLLALVGAVLLIAQSWLLAALFHHWLLLWQGRASLGHPSAWLAGLAVCMVLCPFLHAGREGLSRQASRHARVALRGQLLTQLGRLGPIRRQFGSDGALATQVLEQVDALDGYISRYRVQSLLAVLVPCLIAVVVAVHSPLAAGLMLMTAPLVPLFMILVGRAAAGASQRQFTALARMGGRFLDLVRGMATLQRMGATDQAEAKVAQASDAYRGRTMRVLRLAFLSSAVLEFFAALAIALVALYLGLGLLGLLPWAKADVPVPYQGALFILLLAPEFYAPLRQLGSDYHARAEAIGAMQALSPLLEADTWQPQGASISPALSGELFAVECRELSVSGEGGRLRLAPLNLTLAEGERLLVQGESGAGKSSLLQALLGFTAYQGSLKAKGCELSHWPRDAWQGQLGYLSQQPPIQSGSIAANLRLAAPGKSDAELIEVLTLVGLWPILVRGNGLATPLGERGQGLSGGQLQRLGLAQLLLRDAALWLFDEPTAHLDPDAARQLNTLIGQLSRGRSVIIVSHESAGLEWVDRHIVLSSQEAMACCG